MWTESRYPNTTALLAAPHSRRRFGGLRLQPHAELARVRISRAADASRVDKTWLTSGGKVIPVDGQEHSRTEL